MSSSIVPSSEASRLDHFTKGSALESSATPTSPVRRRPQKMSPYGMSSSHSDLLAHVATRGERMEPYRMPLAAESELVLRTGSRATQHPSVMEAPALPSSKIHASGQLRSQVHITGAVAPGLSPPAPISTTTTLAASPPQGSQLFDAIVQAADPKHPDHAAWKERYGGIASRSSRNSASSLSRKERTAPSPSTSGPSIRPLELGKLSDTDVASQKKNSVRSSRRLHPALGHSTEAQDSDADDASDLSEASRRINVYPRDGKLAPRESSPTSKLARSNSSGSATRARRRRKAREKGKSRVPPLPIPPPRVTSSTRYQATLGSPTLPPDASSALSPSISGADTVSPGASRPFNSPGSRFESSPPPLRSLYGRTPPPFTVAGGAGTASPSSPRQLLQRNTRPLPALPGMQTSPPASDGFSGSRSTSALRQPSPFSLPHGSQVDQAEERDLSSAVHPHSVVTSSSSLRVDDGSEPGRKTRNRSKTSEKGFFTFPKAMFSSKSSQRSLSAALHSPTPTSPVPASPAMVVSSPNLGADRQKSMAKIQQILGTEALVQPGNSQPVSGQGSRKTSMQVSQVLMPSFDVSHQERPGRGIDTGGRRSADAARTLDVRMFPMRGDSEFRADENEFETSDSDPADGMDIEPGASFLCPSYDAPAADRRSPNPGMRAPGVVRRSLDSIISPFRASLNASTKTTRKGPPEPINSVESPSAPRPGRQSMESVAPGRRSISETRLVRPFLRQRPTKNGGRPLSSVNDGPEETLAEERPFVSHQARDSGECLQSSALGAQTFGDEQNAERPFRYGQGHGRGPWGRKGHAGYYDPRSSTIVDAGHSLGHHYGEGDDGKTPRSGFVSSFNDQAISQVVNVDDPRLLPAAELRERGFASWNDPQTNAVGGQIGSSPSEIIENEGFRFTRRRGPSHFAVFKKERSIDSPGPLETSMNFPGAPTEDKQETVPKNVYPHNTMEPRPSSPSAHGSLNAHNGYGAPWSESQHSGALHGSLASVSSCRSLTSAYSHPHSATQMATSSSNHDVSFDSLSKQSATPTSQSRSKFAGLFSRVKGTLTPGKTPPSASLSSFNSPGSTSITTPSQSAEGDVSVVLDSSQSGKFANFAASSVSSPLVSGGSPAGLGFRYEGQESPRKDEKPRRIRAKSLASSRKKSKSPNSNDAEDFGVFMASVRSGEKISQQDEDWRRKLLSEAVGMSFGSRAAAVAPNSSQTPRSEASEPHSAAALATASPSEETEVPSPRSQELRSPEQGGGKLGKLLRKKKTSENLDEVIQSFVAQPPRMTHLDVPDEAAPRPSMSSVRGFDVTEPGEEQTRADGLAPKTIRKTLSPALLSETVETSRDSLIATWTGDGQSSLTVEEPEEFAEVLQSKISTPRIDETEVLVEESALEADSDGVRAPARRFLRRHASIDRLSRVDEASVRGSLSVDSADNYTGRPSLSLPTSPQPRSFSEHRQVRRSVSGTLQPPSMPRALELGTATSYQYGKRSMDVSRPRHLDALIHEASQPRPFPSLPSPAMSPTTPFKDGKSPRKMSFGDSLSPSWSRPSFSLQRTGRTSFSQDRDRAPVASPLSPPKDYASRSPAIVQAMKKLRVPGKRSKSFGKGIGPGDVIIPNFDDYDDDYDDDSGAFDGVRPSMNLARPSMSASRPSINPTRPSVGIERKSMDAVRSAGGGGRSSLASAEMMTKLLQVQADAMVSTPMTANFPGDPSELSGANSVADGIGSETDASVHTAAEASAEGVVGLGLGSVADLSNASRPSLSASTSSGDLRGFRSSDANGHNLLKTPDTSSLHSNGIVYVPKTPELMAFEDMLGKFGQKEKELLRGISARAGTTPAQTPGLASVQGEAAKDYGFGRKGRAGSVADRETGSGHRSGDSGISTTSLKKEAGEAVQRNVQPHQHYAL